MVAPTAANFGLAWSPASSDETRTAPFGDVTTIQSTPDRSNTRNAFIPAGSSTISISGTTTGMAPNDLTRSADSMACSEERVMTIVRPASECIYRWPIERASAAPAATARS